MRKISTFPDKGLESRLTQYYEKSWSNYDLSKQECKQSKKKTTKKKPT